MGRAPCCDKANVKKGPWSPEEDATLKSYIEEHGTGGNWIALPQKIGLKRCGKSCRLRWLNYLRPNIKHGSFSEEEDRIICSLYVSIGSRWSIIAAQLPGRTDNDIKNYWNTRLKKKLFGKNHRCQPPVARRGRKLNPEIGNHPMTAVFDHHFIDQSAYLPELSAAINLPAPRTSNQETPTYNNNDCVRNLLNKLGRRLNDYYDPLLQLQSQLPPDSHQVHETGLPISQGQSYAGKMEDFAYNFSEAFDNELQFLYGEEDLKNDSNGMISNGDWSEISSLISAPSYPLDFQQLS